MSTLFYRLKRYVRYWYLRTLRIRAHPHKVALGLALGVFVGFLPIVPFQIVTAVSLAFLVKGNKLAAALGTWVSNPLNIPFLYYLFYLVGKFFWPGEVAYSLTSFEMKEILKAGWDVFGMMCLGGAILGLPAAILTYFIFVKVLKKYNQKRLEKKYNLVNP